jgi:tellurite resistance protein TerC
LYFLLAGVMDIFRYLRYGLAGILAFVGGKMIADFVATHFEWTGPEEHLLPHWVSLAVIASLLALSIAASVVAARRTPRVPEGPTGDQAPIPAADPPRSSEAPGEASHRH